MVYKNFSNYDIDIDKKTVFSLLKNKYLSVSKHQSSNGYVRCNLIDDFGNKYNVWYEVVYCIGNNITKDKIPYNKNGDRYEIDHIIPVRDGGTDDLSNLRLVTHKENMNNKLSVERFKKRMKGENHPFYGKHLSDETKEKLKKRFSKQVFQYTVDGELVATWTSAVEAGKNGYNTSAINHCCEGINKTHKGFIWKR